MTKLVKPIAFAAIILCASAATAAADGYGFIRSNISQFGTPVQLVMQSVDGDYRLKSANTMVPISYEAGYKGSFSHLRNIDVEVRHITKGNGAAHGLRRDLAPKDKVWGNANLQMTRAHLAPMEKLGEDLCSGHQGPGQKKVDTTIPLTMNVGYLDNSASGVGGGSFTREGSVPATIVCEAPAPKAPPKVSLMQLKFYTLPARPVCGKPVVVMAEFFVNYPGPLNFQYWRDNGDHQNATVTAASAVPAGQHLYLQRWSKTYTFTKTENRKYRIIPQGSALTTDWVDINVHCTGGFANTSSGNSNDGLPPQPKAPQSKGPANENAGSNPTHGAFRPMIAPAKMKPKVGAVVAPATIKTAPANNGSRSPKYIGKAASN